MKDLTQIIQKILRVASKVWFGMATAIGSIVIFSFVIILLLGGLSSGLSTQANLSENMITEGDPDQVVAILRLTGVIVDDVDTSDPLLMGSSFIVVRDVVDTLDHLAKDDGVKAIVLRINSPGGSAVASDELFYKIMSVRESKPMVASLGDIAASGGYYLAAGTNKIMANPSTITGSIGVILELPKLAGLYEKVGLEFRTIQSGKFKDMGSSARDLTPEERQIFQGLIDDSYAGFVKAVADGRGQNVETITQLADGRIYSGQGALENHLVDELGSLSDAVDSASELAELNNPTVIEYSQENFLQTLLGANFKLSWPFFQLSTLPIQPQTAKLYYLYSL